MAKLDLKAEYERYLAEFSKVYPNKSRVELVKMAGASWKIIKTAPNFPKNLDSEISQLRLDTKKQKLKMLSYFVSLIYYMLKFK